MIEIGNIVTLENREDFLIIEEVFANDRRFVYSVKVDENEAPLNEYKIFEVIKKEEGAYLQEVESEALLLQIKEKLTKFVNNNEE